MVIALPVLLALGLMTLAPAVFGLLLAALRLPPLRRLGTREVALAFGVLGALAPAVLIPLLARGATGGDPIALRPFGGVPGGWSWAAGFWTWAAPMYRVDALALYMGAGVAFVVTPLLLWMAFAARSGAGPEDGAAMIPGMLGANAPGAASDEDDSYVDHDDEDELDEDGVPADGGALADDQLVAAGAATPRVAMGIGSDRGNARLVRGVALALLIEAAALTLAFADGLVLAGVAWLVLAALAWGAGEINGEPETLDRIGLLATLVGPAAWLVIMVLAAAGVNSQRFMDLTGQKALPALACVALAVAIALASGAMPFLAWVLRRAGLAAPVGLGALVLALLPAALYVGLRTYTVAADASSHWPQIGAAQPPVTAGIAFAVLGAATIAVAGILALGRRDVRGLVALLALAQVGWGLVGLGVGQPVSVVGVLALLPAAVLGLGALLTSSLAEEVVSNDEVEPDASGPAPLGVSARPLALGAWVIGGLSLVGLPFLPGFAARHLMTAGMVQTSGLAVPLVGICWAGDGLLALALLRATAPALGAWVAGANTGRGRAGFSGRDVPGAILAALAIALGIAPAGYLGAFGLVAAGAVLAPGGARAALAVGPFGYAGTVAQWPSVLAWVAGLVVAGLWLVLRSGGRRRIVPVYVGGSAGVGEELASGRGSLSWSGAAVTMGVNGDDRAAKSVSVVAGADATWHEADGDQNAADRAETNEAGEASDEDEDEVGGSLSEPEIAWSELAPAFTSAWTVPAGQWLLNGGDTGLLDDDVAIEPGVGGHKREAAAVAEEAEHAGD